MKRTLIFLCLLAFPVLAAAAAPTKVQEMIQADESIPAEVKTALAKNGGKAGTVGEFAFSAQSIRLAETKTEFQRERQALLYANEFRVLAVTQMILLPEISDIYQSAKLDHPGTLAKSVESVATTLYKSFLSETVQEKVFRSGDELAVVIWGKTDAIRKELSTPKALLEVRLAFRDLLHRRSLIALEASLQIFKQAQERDLASPNLYLDAAMCYATLRQDAEAQAVILEGLDKYQGQPVPEFFNRAGKILQLVGDKQGQVKALELLGKQKSSLKKGERQ